MVVPKQPVFLLVGDDGYLKEEAVKRIISSLGAKPDDGQNAAVFYGGELNHQEVFDSLNTVPLLSGKRIVIIKDADRVSDNFRADLIAYIKKPSRNAYLLLEAGDDSALQDYSEVASLMSVRRVAAPEGDALCSWIRERLKSEGKSIDDDALAILKELEGNDLHYISMELDKLASFVGLKKNITQQDVEEIAGKSLIKSAFDMADEIGRKNSAGALKVVSGLIGEGKKESELIGLISWYLKRMLKARIMKEEGQSDHFIASSLRIGRRFQTDFFRQLAGFNREKIIASIDTLLQADLDIKRSRFDQGSILELAIIRLCLL